MVSHEDTECQTVETHSEEKHLGGNPCVLVTII